MTASDKATSGLIINYMTLRRLIGWMGVCLPFVVYLGNWVIFTHHVTGCLLPSSKVPYSLSGYYYTHMRGVFTGTFWALGVFLVAYNGFGRVDQVITTLAGLSAIGIATFPHPPVSRFPRRSDGRMRTTSSGRVQVVPASDTYRRRSSGEPSCADSHFDCHGMAVQV
jgi:hypothetical protein